MCSLIQKLRVSPLSRIIEGIASVSVLEPGRMIVVRAHRTGLQVEACSPA